jgi:hypothetical protein
MSINHLISPIQNPRLDVYVREIEAQALDVEFDIKCQNLEVSNNLQVNNDINCDNLIAQTKVEGNLMEAKLQMTMSAQVNTNDIVEQYGAGLSSTLPTNPFLKDISNGSNLTDFSPIIAYVKTRFVDDGTRSITEYNLNFSAVSVLSSSDGSFDFKVLNGFDNFTIPSYNAQNNTGQVIGATSTGRSTFVVPDDPANDYKINIEYPTTSPTSRNIFNFTIRTYKFSP